MTILSLCLPSLTYLYLSCMSSQAQSLTTFLLNFPHPLLVTNLSLALYEVEETESFEKVVPSNKVEEAVTARVT